MANPKTKPPFLNLVHFNRYHGYMLNERKVKRYKDSMKVTKIISENKNRCTENDFIFACSFILFLFLSKSSNNYF